jgi:hypothetical protein
MGLDFAEAWTSLNVEHEIFKKISRPSPCRSPMFDCNCYCDLGECKLSSQKAVVVYCITEESMLSFLSFGTNIRPQ